MSQYVKWDFVENKIIRGPQMSPGDGEGWYPFIEAGKVLSSYSQTVEYVFSEELQTVIMKVSGPIKIPYYKARALEYDSISTQLDNLWHDIDNGTLDKTGKFYTSNKYIKDKYKKD